MGILIGIIIFLGLVAYLNQTKGGQIILTILGLAGAYLFYWKLTGGGL